MNPFARRAVRLGVLGATVACLLLAAWTWTQGRARIDGPWAGFGVLPHAEVGPSAFVPSSMRREKGAPRPGERIVGLGGETVRSAAELVARLERIPAGAPIRYRLENPKGTPREVMLASRRFTERDWREVYLPLLVAGLVALLIGAVPALARPEVLAAPVFFLAALGLAVHFGFTPFDYFVAHRLTPATAVFGALASGSLMLFGLLFPSRIGPARTHVLFTALGVYALHGIFWVAFTVALLKNPHFLRTLNATQAQIFAAGVAVLFGNVAWSAWRGEDAATRQRARFVLVSLGVVLLVSVPALATLFGEPASPVSTLVYAMPLWLLGALLGYALTARNLFELDGVLRRALVGVALLGIAVTVQLLLLMIASAVVGPASAWPLAAGSSLLVVVVAVAIAPLRVWIEDQVERCFYPRRRAAREACRSAIEELATARGEAEIVSILREAVSGVLIARAARLLRGAAEGPLEEVAPLRGTTPLCIGPSDPLWFVLRGPSALSLGPGSGGPALPASAASRARELGTALSIPLLADATERSVLLIGPRTDGRDHTRDDIQLAAALGAQTRRALEHARAWTETLTREERLRAENAFLRDEIDLVTDTGGPMIGQSPALRKVLAQVDRVAATEEAVLVEGERGTGKELLVRALHEQSPRAAGMLVKVPCATLPGPLLESELFGYEQGAVTGTARAKPGRFEMAEGGTLFFDDVDQLSPAVQSRLLDALRSGEATRLGGRRPRPFDVRLVASTSRDLLREVQAGRFREDLYYRIAVVPLTMPSLRERAEDLPLLAEHFVRQESARLGRPVKGIAPEALALLQKHDWPGNLRELRNAIQRALVVGEGDLLEIKAPIPDGAANRAPDLDPSLDGKPLSDQLRTFKSGVIRNALDRTGGNQRLAAEILGMHRQSLTRMIRDLGLGEPRRGAQRPSSRVPSEED